MAKVELELRGRIERLERSLDDVEDNMEKVARQTKKTSNTVDKSFKRNTKNMELFKKALISVLSIGAVTQFTRAIINMRSEFEKYNAVLTNTLGSATKAAKAMQMIKNFAAETPFSVKELTSSYVKLVNQGFKPTEKELRKLGDLAASTGKQFDQLTEAIIDAQVGEFERLKEFGIRAQKEGDKVTFTFKGVQKQVDFTADSIQDYILGLGELRGVTGSMEAISRTLGGRISNLGDSWDSLLNTMGARTTGVFAGIISGLGNLIDLTEGWLSIPVSEQLEKERMEMVSLVGAITNVNISQEARLESIEELQTKYPDYFGNLDTEKVKNEEIRDVLKEINEAYTERIKLAVIEEEETELKDELFKQIKREREAFQALAVLKEKYGDVTLEDIANETAAEIRLNQVRDAAFKREYYAINESQRLQGELRQEIADVNLEYEKQQRLIEELTAQGKKGFGDGGDENPIVKTVKAIKDYDEGIASQLATDIAAIDKELLGLADDTEEFAKAQEILDKYITDRADEEYEKDIRNFENAQATKMALAQTVVRGISNLYSTLSEAVRINKEKELSAVGDNAKKREEIERKYARKEQQIAIGRALISLAEVVLNALKTEPFIPVGLAASILAGIVAGAQIAIIKKQKFEKGGFDVLKGRRHAQGGVDIGIGEAEQGEGVGVFSRKAMSRYGSVIPSLMDAFNKGEFPNISAKYMKGNLDKLQVSLDDSKQLEEIKNLLAKKEKSVRIENGFRITEHRGVTRRVKI